MEVRRETVLPAERAPLTDDQSLVPVGASHPSQALPGANKLGNLEISRTTVQFPCTRVGKTSGTENLSCLMTKPTKLHVRPAKIQISLDIHPV